MNEPKELREKVITALRSVRDPEIPVNLYDLGLIYELAVSQDGTVQIRMTLTTPNCPVAETIPQMVHRAVAAVDGIGEVVVDLVWEPPWTREKMSEDARAQLDMMGIEWSDRGPSQVVKLRTPGEKARGERRK